MRRSRVSPGSMCRCLTPPTSKSSRFRRPRRSRKRPSKSVIAERGEGAMPINILMPALSPTMTEGNLAKWLKNEGDTVKAGDVIAEIETDKATMEVEAVDEGKIGKILVPAGTEGVKVNDVIAVLLEEGESASDIGATPQSNPEPAPKAADAKPKAEAPAPQAAAPKPAAAPTPKPAAAPAGDGKRVFASPLARRIAEQQGIDIASVKG